jgi:hypothetical protein
MFENLERETLFNSVYNDLLASLEMLEWQANRAEILLSRYSVQFNTVISINVNSCRYSNKLFYGPTVIFALDSFRNLALLSENAHRANIFAPCSVIFADFCLKFQECLKFMDTTPMRLKGVDRHSK